MGEIAELVERLQKAGEGSRELDNLISFTLDGRISRTPPCTRSLDAAVALVERKLPGFRWTVGTHPGIRHLLDPTAPAWPCATVSKPYTRGPVSGYESVGEADAPTAPLALCIAILKALEKTDG